MLQDQLYQLTLLQRRKNVSIRVIPFDAAAYPANGVSFSVYDLASGNPYVFLEAHKLGVFVTEEAEVKPFVDVREALDKCALDEQSSDALIRKAVEGFDDE